jgi:hypothetical protein
MPFQTVQQRRTDVATGLSPRFGVKYLAVVVLALSALVLVGVPWHDLHLRGAWYISLGFMLAPGVPGIAVGTITFLGFREMWSHAAQRLVSAIAAGAISAFTGLVVASPIMISIMYRYDEDWIREGPGLAGYFVAIWCFVLAGFMGCIFGAGPGIPLRKRAVTDSGETN